MSRRELRGVHGIEPWLFGLCPADPVRVLVDDGIAAIGRKLAERVGFVLCRYRKLLLFMELRQLVHLEAASLVSTISTISFAPTVCDHFGSFLDTMDTKAFFRPGENTALSPKQFALSEGHLVSIWCQPPRNGYRPVSVPTTSGLSSVIDPTYCYDGNLGDDTYMGGSGPGAYTRKALYHSWPSLSTPRLPR